MQNSAGYRAATSVLGFNPPPQIRAQCEEMVAKDPLLIATEEVVELALEVIGQSRLSKWFWSSKFGLGGRTPASVMNTLSGCQQVKNLLRSIKQAEGAC